MDPNTPDEDQTQTRERLFKELGTIRATKKSLEERHTLFRGLVQEVLDDDGEDDSDGHRWVHTPGWSAKNERRTTVVFLEEKATKWAKERGLWGEVSREVPAHRKFSQDDFVALFYTEGPPPDGTELDDFYETEVSWAVKVQEEQQYDY